MTYTLTHTNTAIMPIIVIAVIVAIIAGVGVRQFVYKLANKSSGYIGHAARMRVSSWFVGLAACAIIMAVIITVAVSTIKPAVNTDTLANDLNAAYGTSYESIECDASKAIQTTSQETVIPCTGAMNAANSVRDMKVSVVCKPMKNEITVIDYTGAQ